jgi:hypothetical protein
MPTVMESSSPEVPTWTPGSTCTVVPSAEATTATETAWLTATIRPAGTFRGNDTTRLHALLDALSACASIVVLDLAAARLRSRSAGEVIQDAACDIERRGGCLMCINVDGESRACLSAAGNHVVVMDDASQLSVRPSMTFVSLRPTNYGRLATSVVPPISFSHRASRT